MSQIDHIVPFDSQSHGPYPRKPENSENQLSPISPNLLPLGSLTHIRKKEFVLDGLTSHNEPILVDIHPDIRENWEQSWSNEIAQKKKSYKRHTLPLIGLSSQDFFGNDDSASSHDGKNADNGTNNRDSLIGKDQITPRTQLERQDLKSVLIPTEIMTITLNESPSITDRRFQTPSLLKTHQSQTQNEAQKAEDARNIIDHKLRKNQPSLSNFMFSPVAVKMTDPIFEETHSQLQSLEQNRYRLPLEPGQTRPTKTTPTNPRISPNSQKIKEMTQLDKNHETRHFIGNLLFQSDNTEEHQLEQPNPAQSQQQQTSSSSDYFTVFSPYMNDHNNFLRQNQIFLGINEDQTVIQDQNPKEQNPTSEDHPEDNLTSNALPLDHHFFMMQYQANRGESPSMASHPPQQLAQHTHQLNEFSSDSLMLL